MNKIRLMQEASRCLICEDAPCTAACKAGDPARAVRAILFRNEANAGRWLPPLPPGMPYRGNRHVQTGSQTPEAARIVMNYGLYWLKDES